MKELFDFKLLSLNVRGVRAATKRKALFTWLNERRYDIIFLQETYSTVDVEDIWRPQWSRYEQAEITLSITNRQLRS